MPLLHNHFQKMSGVIGHFHLGFSSALSPLSETLSCFQENTPLIRQHRPHIGQSFVFTLPFVRCALYCLAAAFSLNCCCATTRCYNYSCLLRKTALFITFSADAVSVSHHNLRDGRILTAQPSPTATTNRGYCIALSITRNWELSTRNDLPPTLWRDWRPYATKHAFRPQNRQVLLMLSPHQPFLPTPPPLQQKANLLNLFLSFTHFSLLNTFFCFYFALCTQAFPCLTGSKNRCNFR